MRSFISLAESLESRRLLSNTALLDPSFGDSGLATMEFPGVENRAGTRAISPAADGKVVALSEVSSGTLNGIGLARFKSDGTLDTTFGTNGYVVRMYDATVMPRDMTVDADGRILIVSQFLDRNASGATDEFFTVRLNADGSIDRTFGAKGSVRTSFSDLGFGVLPSAITISSGGHIAVAGRLQVDVNGTTDSRVAIAEYTDTGALTAFSTDGRAVADTPGTLPTIGVERIEYQADGKLVVAGSTREDFLLVRYNTNGTLDHSFSSDGLASADFSHGSSDAAYGMAIQPDGKILIGGTTGSLGAPVALARFGSNGSIDTSFGIGGIVTAFGTPLASRRIDSIGVLGNGQIIVTGVAGTNALVGLFNSDGTIDTSFGENGSAEAAFGSIGPRSVDLIIQSDGKLLVSGSGQSDFSPLIARFGRDDIGLTNSGNLIVTGTSGNDQVLIRRVGKNVQATFNGVVQLFTSPVHSINAQLIGGNDSFSSSLGLPTTVDGGTGSDVITTGIGNDVITGAAGNDTITSGGGDDIVSGGAGRDVIFGGVGDDQLNGGSEADVISGDDGNDSIIDYGGDSDFGGAGNDIFIMAGGSATLAGGDGNDTIVAAGDSNTLFGDAGDDHITGGNGRDNIQGGEGNDILEGGEGDDQLGGNAGADTLIGGVGADFLSGNGGKDSLQGSGGKDRLYGGDGNDDIDGGADADRLFGQDGIDKLTGGSGNDSLDGGKGVDQFFGNSGDDDIFSRDENTETLDGGTGNDHGIIDSLDTLLSVETSDQLFS